MYYNYINKTLVCNVRIDDVYHMYVCGYISIHDIVHVKSYPSKMLRARNIKHGNLRSILKLGECETAQWGFLDVGDRSIHIGIRARKYQSLK